MRVTGTIIQADADAANKPGSRADARDKPGVSCHLYIHGHGQRAQLVRSANPGARDRHVKGRDGRLCILEGARQPARAA